MFYGEILRPTGTYVARIVERSRSANLRVSVPVAILGGRLSWSTDSRAVPSCPVWTRRRHERRPIDQTSLRPQPAAPMRRTSLDGASAERHQRHQGRPSGSGRRPATGLIPAKPNGTEQRRALPPWCCKKNASLPPRRAQWSVPTITERRPGTGYAQARGAVRQVAMDADRQPVSDHHGSPFLDRS
jgi:hypothetical protein